MFNKNLGDDNPNPALQRASVCWTFRPHDPQFSNLDPRPPVFKPYWRLWWRVAFVASRL